MINMIGYIQSLDRLGFPLGEEFATDVILNSLPSAYGPFISNYHMHGMDKKITELHGMLKTAEANLKKGVSQVLMVQNASKIKKKSWSRKKAKSKGHDTLDPSHNAASVAKPTKSPGTVCFYYKEDGHWNRNCAKYEADKARGGSVTSDSATIV
ncbi:hypothetical protein JBE27_54500, partial [Streptomyces albiflaviniger]|nr:hypothetical protein [Streptomyces albiflaviniger]